MRSVRRRACQAEVAYFCRVFVDEQNIGRLNVTMNQTLSVGGTQSFRDLNAGLEHQLFGQVCLLLDQIIEASMINQLHYEIKLPMICSGREYLNHIGMIYGGGNARFLLQL